MNRTLVEKRKVSATEEKTIGTNTWLGALGQPETPAGVLGDYNSNGKVDAADYVLWKQGGPLANEVDNLGTVNGADYTEWRARFGNPGAGLAGGAEVPEPATLAHIMVCGLWLLGFAKCRSRFAAPAKAARDRLFSRDG